MFGLVAFPFFLFIEKSFHVEVELRNIRVIQIFPYIESIVFSPLSYEILSLGSVPFSCYDSFNGGPLSRPLRVNGINRRRVTEIFN